MTEACHRHTESCLLLPPCGEQEEEDRQRLAECHATHRLALQWGWPSAWPDCSGISHNVQVCGGQMGEKEKWSSLSIMKRRGRRDSIEGGV